MALPSKEEDPVKQAASDQAAESQGFIPEDNGGKSEADQPTENHHPAALSTLARLMVRVFPYGFIKSSLVSQVQK